MLLCSHIPPEAGKAADEGGLPAIWQAGLGQGRAASKVTPASLYLEVWSGDGRLPRIIVKRAGSKHLPSPPC
jgi:DNA-binding protein H-NS